MHYESGIYNVINVIFGNSKFIYNIINFIVFILIFVFIKFLLNHVLSI